MGRISDNQGYFLRSGSLAPYREASKEGLGLLGASDALLSDVEQRCGRDAASLFARPYLTDAPEGSARSVSWYTSVDGTAVRWIDLDPHSREQASADIRTAVAGLEPALRDPSIGPSVQRALNVGDLAHDLLLVGGKPVLTNWGLLPLEIAADTELRQAHWERGLGAILARAEPPPFSDADANMEADLPAADISQPASMNAAATAMPLSQSRRAIPSWVWPAAASGAVLVAILLLLFAPRFGLLPAGFGSIDSGAHGTLAALEQRASALRGGLSDPCAPVVTP